VSRVLLDAALLLILYCTFLILLRSFAQQPDVSEEDSYMHFWLIFTTYSCLCIWLAAMSAAAQSGAYAQQDPYCTSDLRLDLTSNVYDYETQEVRQHVSVRLAGLHVLNSPLLTTHSQSSPLKERR